MKFKTMDDIEREKHNEKRTKIKEEITEDVNEVIGNILGKPKKKKTFVSWIFSFFKILGFIFLIVIFLDIILGSVWLLEFLVKDLFF